MIDWLRRVFRLSPPTRQLPTDLERTAPRHDAILAKADRAAERLEDYRRMDGALVITRKPR